MSESKPVLTASEYAAHLRTMLVAAELPPVDWAGPIDDVDEFLSGTQRRTDEHGDAGGAGWAIQSRDGEIVVAFTGTGPHAAAYAELIAYLLNGAERIASELARAVSHPPVQPDRPDQHYPATDGPVDSVLCVCGRYQYDGWTFPEQGLPPDFWQHTLTLAAPSQPVPSGLGSPSPEEWRAAGMDPPVSPEEAESRRQRGIDPRTPAQPVPSGLDAKALGRLVGAVSQADGESWAEHYLRLVRVVREVVGWSNDEAESPPEFAALTAAPAPEEGLREAALAVWRRAQDIDHWRDDDEVAEALVPVLRSALGESNR